MPILATVLSEVPIGFPDLGSSQLEQAAGKLQRAALGSKAQDRGKGDYRTAQPQGCLEWLDFSSPGAVL